ncbi:MAG: helix-turn-helix domain-containing protein [Chlamydiales bacterium]|nr:helix-turn-helix domain-containing protein [Chlamydiales bacterium]
MVPLGSTLDELEKQLIMQTLDAQNNNRTKTAGVLGISIRTLRNKLHLYRTKN